MKVAELAKLVVDTIENKPSGELKLIYEDTDNVRDKIKRYPKKSTVPPRSLIRHWQTKRSNRSKAWASPHYPICIAKTQYSFSSDPKAYGVAKDFELKVRDIIINNGAEMIVVIMGEIMRMPGLPERPAGKTDRHRERADRRVELIKN